MSILSLSRSLDYPCYVLYLPKLTVMLDCALDISTVLHFLPLDLVQGDIPGATWDNGRNNFSSVRAIEGRLLLNEPHEFRTPAFGMIDMESVDILLVSSCRTMLALPYLTERTGFHGVVYATEPSVEFGHQLMTCLIEHSERVNRLPSSSTTSWKTPEVLEAIGPGVADATAWQNIYTAAEAASAIQKCTAVSFGENIHVLGGCTLNAHSSGFCIGSANWVIKTPEHKVVYLGSGSKGFNRHPLALDVNSLKEADACIVTGIARYPLVNPDAVINEMLTYLVATVASGGSVLLPTFSNGIVYDLIDQIITKLGGTDNKLVPVFFLSPASKASLAYANICPSWLCPSKSDRVFMPEWPFAHADYAATGVLQQFNSVTYEFMNSFSEPCVLIADQPTLRSGDATHFMKMWAGSEKNCCLVVEPDFPIDDLMAPFVPLAMNTKFCPIDPSLNFHEVNAVLSEAAPKTVIAPRVYLSRSSQAGTTIEYSNGDILPIDFGVDVDIFTSEYEQAFISTDLAKDLTPSRIDKVTTAVGISATLNRRDYRNMLSPSLTDKKRKILLGNLLPSRVLQALSQHGFQDVSVTRSPDKDTLSLNGHDAHVVLSTDSTEIITNDNESLRLALRDAILTLLTEL